MFKRKSNPVAKQLSNPMNKPRTQKPSRGTGSYRRKSKYPNDILELDIYYATDFGRKMWKGIIIYDCTRFPHVPRSYNLMMHIGCTYIRGYWGFS